MPKILITLNGQNPQYLPSTGMFGNKMFENKMFGDKMIGINKDSTANTSKEALDKVMQQIPKIAPGYIVKNGVMDIQLKNGVYVVPLQKGGRRTRRQKSRRNKTHKRKSRRHRR